MPTSILDRRQHRPFGLCDQVATPECHRRMQPRKRNGTVDPKGLFEHLAYPALLDPGWTSTSSMAFPRLFHASTMLADGRVLTSGSLTCVGSLCTSSSSAEIFDPATETWAITGSMGTDRFGHGMALMGNGKVLVAGGN